MDDNAKIKPDKPYALFCSALVIVTFLFLVWKTTLFALNFPYWDAWNFVPFVAKSMESHVTFADYWVMHNEHRPLFPRMLMLALATLSEWDVSWEIAANLAMGAGIFGIIASLVFRISSSSEKGNAYWGALPIIAMFAFSWGQMENWIWGWCIMVFMSVLFVCLGVYVLSMGGRDKKLFALGVIFAFVATFSFANGMLFWIAAIPLVLFVDKADVSDRLPFLGIWIISAAFSMALYFYHYEQPGVSPSLLDALGMPFQFLGFIILFLSGPISSFWFEPTWHVTSAPVGFFHFIPGTLGLGAMCYLTYQLLFIRKVPLHILAPWFAFALYSLGSDFIISIGRVGLGMEGGVTSRYNSIANLFWFALIGLYLCRLHFQSDERVKGFSISKFSKIALLSALSAFSCFGAAHANARLEEFATWKRLSWCAIQMGFEHPMFLLDVSGDAEKMRTEYLPFLKEHRLCGLSDIPQKDPAKVKDFLWEAQRFMERGMIPQAQLYASVVIYLDENNGDAMEIIKAINALKK